MMYDKNMAHLNREAMGRFIAARRKELGFTQRSLADLLHIDFSTLGGIEIGRSLPSIELLIDLSSALKLSHPGLLLNILAGQSQVDPDDPELRSRSEVTDQENFEEYRRDLQELPDLDVLKQMAMLSAELLARAEKQQSQNRDKNAQPKS